MFQPDLIQDSIALAYNTPRTDPPLYPPSPPPTENSQSPISTLEYQAYYSGLPSYPSLIARSSSRHTPWVAPTDRFADAQPKELRPVGSKHKLNELWEAHLVQGFLELLDEEDVDWTSVDVLRIVNEGQPTCSKPPIVWVGVVPDSLDPVRGFEVAVKCKEYLPEELADVEVEFRESVVNFLGGEGVDLDVGKQEVDHEQDHIQFLPPPSDSEPTAELRRSLTATLGQSIAAQSTSWSDCTGGFYISVPTSASSENVEGQSDISNTGRRVFLVTARHALLPLSIWGNDTYDYDALSKSPPNPANDDEQENEKENILLLGDKAFSLYLARIQEKITAVVVAIELRRRELQELRGKEDRKARVENILEELEESLQKHTEYFQHVLKTYSRSSSRVLGHLSYSPSLHFIPSNPSPNLKPQDTQDSHNQNHDSFLLDYALIELSTSTSSLTQENLYSFNGNAISLHSDLTPSDVSLMMDPALRRRYMKAASQRGPLARVLEREKQREREGRRFLYPLGGLLRVGAEVVGVEEMRRPVRLEVPVDDDEHDEHKTDENKKNVHPNLLDEDDWGSASTSAPSRDQFHLEQERRRKQEAQDAKDPDVMVLKRGHTTGLTIGRANTIFSYIRHTERHMSLGGSNPPSTSPATVGAGVGASAAGAAPAPTSASTSTSSPPPPTKHKSVISKAWPILPYGTYPHTPQHHRQGVTTPFAAHGDSGALVVDALGEGAPSSSSRGYSGGPSSRSPGNSPSSYSGSTARLGGILTAGCGGPDSRPTRFGDVRGVFGRCDVAYALPVEVVLADLRGRFGGVEVGLGG